MIKLLNHRIIVKSLRFTAVRFQSSTKNTNINQILKSQLKVTQRKCKKSDFNSLSNQNITDQKEVEKASSSSSKSLVVNKELKVNNDKRIKKDYTSLPKVPSTNYLNPESIYIDALYAGFRPLAMDQLKLNLLPNKRWYARSRFVNSIWSVSAAGLEEFDDWDRFDIEEINKIKPYNTPKDTNVKQGHYKDRRLIDLEAAVDEMIHRVNMILPEPPQKRLILKKGRTKPNAIKLAKKLKKKQNKKN